MKVDFSGVQDFQPLPGGTYEAVVVSAEEKTAQTSGNQKVTLKFQITSPPEFDGRNAWADLSLMPQALWKYKQTMVRLGVSPEVFHGAVDTDEINASVIGMSCQLSITQRTNDNNKVLNDVEVFELPGAFATFF